MVSLKMKNNLHIVMSSFYSFMEHKDFEKKLKEVILTANNYVGKQEVLIRLTLHLGENKKETKTFSVKEFDSQGFEISKDVEAFEFELFIKTKTNKNNRDQVADMKDVTIFKSDLFVAVDDMTKHGKIEKVSKINNREYINVDKIIFQDHSNERIKFEGVNIYEA